MSLQTRSYLEKLLKGIKKGKPAEGYFSYLNDLESLVELQSGARTTEQFLTLEHLG